MNSETSFRDSLGTSSLTWKYKFQLRNFTINLETTKLFWKQNIDYKSTTMIPGEKLCSKINRDVSKFISVFPNSK